MATSPVQVLKENCSLIGKSLIPVIMRVKFWDPEVQKPRELCRIRKNEHLENLPLASLIQEFERITGEAVKDVLALAGKEESLEATRILLHETVIYANSMAQRGQRLTVTSKTPSASTTSTSGSVSGTAGSSSAGKDRGDDTNRTLKQMRQDLDALKNKTKDLQVEDALQYVRTLASRPKLTSNHSVLLAAVEMLVDAANKTDHKDSLMFHTSLAMCRKYQDHKDFCGLVLKFFGFQEDKKISSLVADWEKSKKYDDVDKVKSHNKEVSRTPEPLLGFPGYGFPNPGFGMPYPGFFPGPSAVNPSFGFRPPYRGGAGRGKRRANGACFYCKEEGHFVSNCHKIKKE